MRKHTKYMHNKHTNKINNMHVHAMDFFLNIYINVRQLLYLNEIVIKKHTIYIYNMHNKHPSILQEQQDTKM